MMCRFLTAAEPWKLKGAENEVRRKAIVRTAMEALYAFAHFLAPVIPVAAGAIFSKLHTAPVSSAHLRHDFYNLAPGTSVTVGEILFTKIKRVATGPDGAGATAGQSIAGASKGKSKAKGKASRATASAEAEQLQHQIDFTKIELRVGRVAQVWAHPTAERLFCVNIKLTPEAQAEANSAPGQGETGQVRQVASGLRGHYTAEELLGRQVVLVCNLKESKFQGFLSQGMVLAAKETKGSEEEQAPAVELVCPPAGSVVGERVFLRGYEDAGPGLAPVQVKRLKVWEAVMPDLRTDDEGVACWREMPLLTSAGSCTVSRLRGAPIS